MGNLGPRVSKVLDLIVAGRKNREIAEELQMVYRTVKLHCNRLYLRYGVGGGDAELKRIKLAVKVFYERNPERVPFSDGDRAGMLGQTSATVFAAQRLAAEEFNAQIYWKGVRARQSRKSNHHHSQPELLNHRVGNGDAVLRYPVEHNQPDCVVE